MVGSSSTSRLDGLASDRASIKPPALAAGQHFQRRAHLFLREQKVLHIADDVFRLAADHDVVAAAAGEGIGQGRFWIEAFAVLVQRRHFDIGAEPDSAAVGRAAAGQHIDQRGLAGAIRADNADAVAALDADRKPVDDFAVADRIC